MTTLSSAAWMLHDVGLATSIGGTLFGHEALHPALREIDDRRTREHVANVAWRRFSWLNLASHAAVAATWFIGRSILRGCEVSNTARKLTVAKDTLVIASLVTGVGSMLLGRFVGKRTEQQPGPSFTGDGEATRYDQRTNMLRRAVGTLGMANLFANIGIGTLTTALAMEGSKSLPFSVVRRTLP